MLSAIAIVPSAPVLVAELAGDAAAETTALRAAATTAAAALGPRWIVLGAAESDGRYGPQSRGTFAGYGADVPIALSPGALSPGALDAAPVPLPLCVLIAGWLRGVAAPAAEAEVLALSSGLDPDDAWGRGQELRAELDRTGEPVGVLVVADGFPTLTAAAPGGYDPQSVDTQTVLDDALAAGDAEALRQTPPGVVGRVAYQALGGLAAPGPRATEELYRGAPYGVGYFVGLWTP
ncbi:hypothetical protein ACQI4F_00340 [Mycolicibacterium vaccae]|uniref:hypothetical protein n=1 Tax=Mycolicibacterium vaccae TaxID=1810 RepID=UPI003CF84B12